MNFKLLTNHDLLFSMVLTRSKGRDGNECLRRLGAILETVAEARDKGESVSPADLDYSGFTDDDLAGAEGHFIALMAAFKRRKRSLKFCSGILDSIILARARIRAPGKPPTHAACLWN